MTCGGRLLAAIASAAALFVMCSVIDGPYARPLGDPSGIRAANEELSIIEKVQHYLGDTKYCSYRDGWKGPGWYVCGYNDRPGRGWGGPFGWQGWRVGGGARVAMLLTAVTAILAASAVAVLTTPILSASVAILSASAVAAPAGALAASAVPLKFTTTP